jgi:hypothetical protein
LIEWETLEYQRPLIKTPGPGHAARWISLDQAGWHVTPKLAVPDNIALLSLRPKSPALNLVKYVWRFMRENWLSNDIFIDYDDNVAHCCGAWNKLAGAARSVTPCAVFGVL